MDNELPKPNLTEAVRMRGSIAKDARFSNVLESLVTKEKDGVTTCFTQHGATILSSPDQQQRLEQYVDYSKSYNEYLDNLMSGEDKVDDHYMYKEGEKNGLRIKLGKAGVEGQVYNFPPYVVKETKYPQKVYSDKYIPTTQVESLMVMEGLRPVVDEEMKGLVSIPEHYGVVSYELPSGNIFDKPKVDLLIMQKVGDDKGTTVEDVEKGAAYQDQKAAIAEKSKQALALLRELETKLPFDTLRDLGAHNLLIDPEALHDDSKPLFYLIDQ